MVLFINQTGIVGEVYNGMNDITGSVFLTLLIIVILVLLIAVVFRIGIEWTAIFILPMLITFMAFESDFLAIAGVFLIYMGILVGKNLFFTN